MKLNLPMLAAMQRAELLKISEYDFQVAVTRYAEDHGWKAQYFRKTAVKGKDGNWRGLGYPGWPDLVLARESDGRLMMLELKARRGKATEAQLDWLHTLAVCGCETDVVKPDDAADIMERLQ